jgi:uncharacterized protein YycO
MNQVHPMAGDFGLTRVNGEVGRLIRFGQLLDGVGFEDYEHAFIYLGAGVVVEAEPGGARAAKVSEYQPEHILWSTGHFDLTTDQRIKICGRARAFTAANNGKGVPYSFLDYLALTTHRLHIPAPGLQNYIYSSQHVICSQLVDICYQAGGVQLFTDGRWAGFVTPGDLYGRLTNA